MARIIGRITSSGHQADLSTTSAADSASPDDSNHHTLPLSIIPRNDRPNNNFARFPRPRSRLLPSGVGNLLSHLPHSPVKKALVHKADPGAYVASTSSPVLEAEPGPTTEPISLPPVSQLTLTKDQPLQLVTQDVDPDYTITAETVATEDDHDLSSMLDTMLPGSTSSLDDPRILPPSAHRRNQSESQLPGLYNYSNRSLRDITQVFEASKSSTSSPALAPPMHGYRASYGTTTPYSADSESPLLATSSPHRKPVRYRAFPVRNQSFDSLNSSAHSSHAPSIFSPGLSSSTEWFSGPLSPYPDSPSSPTPSSHSRAEKPAPKSPAHDETIRPRPGRMMTDYTMATSICSDEDALPASDIEQLKQPNQANPPHSPSKARALIDLFEHHEVHQAAKADQPVVHCRVSPHNDHRRLPHTAQLTPAQSTLADTICQSITPRPPIKPLESSVSRAASPCQERKVSTLTRMFDEPSHSHTSSPHQLQRMSPTSQPSATLPLSDLVPAASPTDGQQLAIKLDPQRQAIGTARLTPSSSLRRMRETGDLSLSTEGAQAMLGSAESSDSSPLQAGRVWYYTATPSSPLTAQWVRAQAVLLPSALALSWIPRGGGRENIVLELGKCKSVHSLPSIENDASSDDIGAQQAKSQGLASIKPLQFVFEDGVERLALDSIKERSAWVLAARDALSGQQETVSPLVTSKQPTQLERISGALGANLSKSHSRQTMDTEAPPLPPKRPDSPVQTQEVFTSRPQRVSTIGRRVQSLRPSVDEVMSHTVDQDDSIVERQIDDSAETAAPLKERAIQALRPPSLTERETRRISGSDFTFGGHELFPSDSASQRPPQSDADERIELPEQLYSLRSPAKAGQYRPGEVLTAGQRSPVKVMGNVAPTAASTATRSGIRTPAQIFRDQFLSTNEGNGTIEERSEVKSSSVESERRLGTVMEETRSQAAAEGASSQRSRPVSEVAKVLTYLEQEKASQMSRDKQIEEQLTLLKRSISELSAKKAQRKASLKRADDQPAEAVRSAESLQSARSYSEIQKQLSKVVEIVSKVSQDHDASEEVRSMTQSELGRIGRGVDELLERVQHRKPVTSGGTPLSRVGSIYTDGKDPDSDVTPTVTEYATPTPRRAWDSTAGSTHAPPPSPKGKKSSTASSRGNREGFQPLAAWQERAGSRPSSPSKKTEATLDMEAAIRKRRAEQVTSVSPDNVHAQGGWYSPKKAMSVHQQKSVSDVGPGDGARARSILAHMPMAQSVRDGAKEDEGPLHDEADRGIGAPESASIAKAAAEITSALSHLKQDEELRKTQQKQQSDIAGYLNELNTWLTADVKERSDNFKALSEGVSKLAEEVAALKTSSKIDAKSATADVYPPQSMGNQPHPDGMTPDVSATREATGDQHQLPTVDGAGQDGAAQPSNWPFRKPSSGPPSSGADANRSNGAKFPFTPNPAAEEARSAVLNAAEDEVARHFASMERVGQAPPADGGTGAVSEKSASQLGEAASKKNTRSVRRIIRELAAAGAGATALKMLKDHFHKERSTEEEEAASQVPVADTPAVPVIKEKKKKSRRSRGADSTPHPSHALLETAMNAAKEGKLSEALSALKEGHLMDAVHSMQGKSHGDGGGDGGDDPDDDGDTSRDSTTSSSSSKHSKLHHLKQGLMGAASGAVIAFAIEELMKHLHEKKEEEKVARLEQEKREAEREAARLEADKAREEKLFEMQQKHSTAIIEALNDVMKQEREARDSAANAKSQELDPKTAIEALVQALNETRIEEAAKRAQTDAAIATLATEVIKQTGSQHEHLLMTLAHMSKDLVKNGIDHHLDHFRGAMANSFAGSAQAMADAWKSHAKEATAAAATGPKAIQAPAPAPAPAPAAPAPAPATGQAAPAAAKPSPPPRRRGGGGGRTGPYGVPVR